MPSTRDLTAHDEAALARAVARYDRLCDAMPLAIAVFDERLQLVRANAGFRQLVGAERGTTTGAANADPGCLIYDAFPNALADLGDEIDAALRFGTPRAARVTFHHRGTARVVDATLVPLGDEEPRAIAFVASDVTEREALRDDLARSATQLATIFDVMPDSVRVFDASGRIVRSNAQAQRSHRPAPTTLGELWQHDRPRAASGVGLFLHEHPCARALRGEQVRGETLAVRRGVAESRLVTEVNATPLIGVAGDLLGAVMVERDVTERARLAEELEEQVKLGNVLLKRVSTEADRLEHTVRERSEELVRLEEARAREERLAAVGSLAAGVMHDVNNALNPIMAAAHLLVMHADEPDAVRDYAARIAKAAEAGAATAARVGRFIRQEPIPNGGDALANLAAIAREVVLLTEPLWAERTGGASVALDFRCDDSVIVAGIAGELRCAIINLVHNALDAMAGGGTLAISTRARGSEVLLEVRDTGLGMAADVARRAFEPFYTTKGRRGTGLGLAEVYGIMKRHRGRVELESVPGEGTSIRLVFPAAGRAPDAAPHRAGSVAFTSTEVER